VEPFIGIIITPYDKLKPSNVSQFQFIFVGPDLEPLGSHSKFVLVTSNG